MTSGFGEPTQSPVGCDIGNFECNICFDLAQDPILTLCGHLFCWPCLYKWLHILSHSNECPVCKVPIEEEKLVPLYGRGKNSTDPRSKSLDGSLIPSRPSGQRPQTASQQDPNRHEPHGFGFMGMGLEGLGTRGSTILSQLRSENGGSLFHPLFTAQMRRSPADALYGGIARYSYEDSRLFRHGHFYALPLSGNLERQLVIAWKVLVVMLIVVLIALFY